MTSTQIKGLLAVAQFIDMTQGPERAKELFEKALPNKDAMRNLGVISLLDEKKPEIATQHFESAYLSEDLRSLPWLITSIEAGGISNFKIEDLNAKFEELISEKNEDTVLASYQISQIKSDIKNEIHYLALLLEIKSSDGDLILAQIINDNDKFDLVKTLLLERKIITSTLIEDFEERINFRNSLCLKAEKKGSIEAIVYQAGYLVDSGDFAAARKYFEKAAQTEEFFALIEYIRFECMLVFDSGNVFQHDQFEIRNVNLLIKCADVLEKFDLYQYIYWNLFIPSALSFMPLPESEKLRLRDLASKQTENANEFDGFYGEYDEAWEPIIEEFERFRNKDGSIENLDRLLSELAEADEEEFYFNDTEDLFAQFINDDEFFRGDTTGPRAMTDPEIFRVIYKYCEFNENIEIVLATSPHCPNDIIDKLAESEFEWQEESTKQTLARNQRNWDLLRKLANADSSTRYYVAGNPYAPMDVLEQLSKDSGYSEAKSYMWDPAYSNLGSESLLIRYAVSNNPRCTLRILEAMKSDLKGTNNEMELNLIPYIARKIENYYFDRIEDLIDKHLKELSESDFSNLGDFEKLLNDYFVKNQKNADPNIWNFNFSEGLESVSEKLISNSEFRSFIIRIAQIDTHIACGPFYREDGGNSFAPEELDALADLPLCEQDTGDPYSCFGVHFFIALQPQILEKTLKKLLVVNHYDPNFFAWLIAHSPSSSLGLLEEISKRFENDCSWRIGGEFLDGTTLISKPIEQFIVYQLVNNKNSSKDLILRLEPKLKQLQNTSNDELESEIRESII